MHTIVRIHPPCCTRAVQVICDSGLVLNAFRVGKETAFIKNVGYLKVGDKIELRVIPHTPDKEQPS